MKQKRIPLFYLFLLLIGNSLFAQETSVKFGRVSLQDFRLREKVPDSSAAALILYDYGRTYYTFDEKIGIIINTDYHIRKRILSNDATDLGVVDLVFYRPNYNNGQSVSDFKGKTYWLENNYLKFSDVTSKDIFETRLENSLYNKKVTFPNVTSDCIIEYSYTFSSPMNVTDKPSQWYFQGKYPVLYSEYTIKIPGFLNYSLLMTGYIPLDKRETEREHINIGHSQLDGTGTHHRFVVQNVPAFKDEPYVSSRENFISKIDFELTQSIMPGTPLRSYSTTWEDINRTLLESESFGKVILRKTNYVKEYLAKFNHIKDKEEKLRAVYKEISNTFEIQDKQWRVFIKDEQKKVLDNRKGTPNQVNALFISVLRELGYDANPVILSRRSNGSINRNLPMLDSFDYIIAKVNLDKGPMLIDVTRKSMAMGSLPFECLNQTGFEVKHKGGEFIDIVPREKHWTTIAYKTELDAENGLLKGSVARGYMGYSGYYQREMYNASGANFESDYQKQFKDYKIENMVYSNEGNTDLPFNVNYEFTRDEEDYEVADFIYFNPSMDERVDKNPFTLENRQFPVDFGYAYETIFSNTIKVPSGYEIESLPKSELFALPDKSAAYTYSISFNEKTGEINLLTRRSIKNPLYYAENYYSLKELFSYVVKKSNEQIVLKRK